MHDFFVEIAGAVIRAWNKMMTVALPQKLSLSAAAGGKHYEAAGFVVLGWLLGMLAAAAGGLTMLLFNQAAGSFVFAAVAWLCLLFHDRGRGDGLIAARISGILPGESIPFGVVIPVFMMILKFVLLMGVFYYGTPFFGGIIIAGGFAIEALLLADSEFSPPVFDASELSMRRYWTAAVIVLVFTFLWAKPATALTILGFALILKHARSKFDRKGLTADDIRFYGALMVWTAAASGILTF